MQQLVFGIIFVWSLCEHGVHFEYWNEDALLLYIVNYAYSGNEVGSCIDNNNNNNNS